MSDRLLNRNVFQYGRPFHIFQLTSEVELNSATAMSDFSILPLSLVESNIQFVQGFSFLGYYHSKCRMNHLKLKW